MSHFDTLPWWIAIPVALFMMMGATLTFLGALGLVQLRNFYDRLHAPTLGTSWGAAGILLASMLLVSWTANRFVLHELVIGVFIMVTTPVTLMLLGRAGLHRDRNEGVAGVPGARDKAGPVLPKPEVTPEEAETSQDLPPGED